MNLPQVFDQRQVVKEEQAKIVSKASSLLKEIPLNLFNSLKRKESKNLRYLMSSILWTQDNLLPEVARVALCLSESLMIRYHLKSGFLKNPTLDYFELRLSNLADISLEEAKVIWPIVFKASKVFE